MSQQADSLVRIPHICHRHHRLCAIVQTAHTKQSKRLSPPEPVNPWRHDLSVFRVIFLKKRHFSGSRMSQRPHLVVFNLEVVHTFEIMQGAPFYPHLIANSVLFQNLELQKANVLFFVPPYLTESFSKSWTSINDVLVFVPPCLTESCPHHRASSQLQGAWGTKKGSAGYKCWCWHILQTILLNQSQQFLRWTSPLNILQLILQALMRCPINLTWS